MKHSYLSALLVVTGLARFSSAQSILFDFENARLMAPFPLDVTAGGVTAHLSDQGYGYSIQQFGTSGIAPTGFSGYMLYPNSVYRCDMYIGFSTAIKDFSIMYAPHELACDSSARMRVTAFMNSTQIATTTTTAPQPGTWPRGTLSIAPAQPFNKVVIHYDAPPPTGGDYGVIFACDNMRVTPAPVPEPATLATLGLGTIIALRRRRQA